MLLYPIFAWVLIVLPMPEISEDYIISKEQAKLEGMSIDQILPFEHVDFKVRDGVILNGSRYASTSPNSLLFLHGASGHSSQLNKSIAMITEKTGIEVFTYDHRGHGGSPGLRGHLDFVGQYVSDLSDVIEEIRKIKPNGQLILAGHSMGGGIIQSYAMTHEAKPGRRIFTFCPSGWIGLSGYNHAESCQPSQEPCIRYPDDAKIGYSLIRSKASCSAGLC